VPGTASADLCSCRAIAVLDFTVFLLLIGSRTRSCPAGLFPFRSQV
jgi:hypothetical protein